jgi:hypothetical protein
MDKKEFKTTLPALKRNFTSDISEYEFLLNMPVGIFVEFGKSEISAIRLREIIRLLNIKAKPPFHMTIRERQDEDGWVVVRTDIKPERKKKKSTK